MRFFFRPHSNFFNSLSKILSWYSLLSDTDKCPGSRLQCVFIYFAIVGSIRGPSTAGAGPTTTTQTSTTSTRGMPSSTKRPSVSTANTQERSSRTWRGAQRCRTSSHRCIRCFILDFIYSSVHKGSENLNHTRIILFLPFQQYIRAGIQNVLCLHDTWCWFVQI